MKHNTLQSSLHIRWLQQLTRHLVYVIGMVALLVQPVSPLLQARAASTAAPDINGVQSRIELSNSNPSLSVQNGSYFGSAVTAIGDVNGDGTIDIASGAHGDDTTGTDRGAAYIMLMRPDQTISQTIKLAAGANGAPGLGNGDAFGRALAGIGDVNGDGVPDLAVGAYADDTGGVSSNRGAVHLLMLRSNGTVSSSIKIAQGLGGFTPTLATDDFFGSAVDAIGDLNNDGIGDLVVGASGDGAQGAAYVLFMAANNTVSQSVKLQPSLGGLPSLSGAAAMGLSVSGVGDVNNDGIPDIALGAPLDSATQRGRIIIAFMRRDGTVDSAVTLASGLNGIPALPAGAKLGFSVTGIGDVDGDGIPDLAAGLPEIDSTLIDTGMVMILNLNRNGSVRRALSLAHQTNGVGNLQNIGWFGYSVAGLGDINLDGSFDLAVGVNREGSGATLNRGDVYLLLLSNQPTDLQLSLSLTPSSTVGYDFIDYTLSYTNAGPFTAFDTVITHVLPAQIETPSYINSGTALSRTAGITYSWTIPVLNSGEGGIITMTGQVREAAWGQVLTSTGDIAWAGVDAVPSNNTQTRTLTSVPPPPITDLVVANSGPAIPSATVELSASTSSLLSSAEWLFDDGHPNQSGNPISRNYPTTGDYTATVVVRSWYGAVATDTTMVRVREALQGLAITAPVTVDVGSNVTLSASVTTGEADGYTWDFGDGQGAVGKSIAHIFGAPGIYTVSVTAYNLVSTLTSTTNIEAFGLALTPTPSPTPLPSPTATADPNQTSTSTPPGPTAMPIATATATATATTNGGQNHRLLFMPMAKRD